MKDFGDWHREDMRIMLRTMWPWALLSLLVTVGVIYLIYLLVKDIVLSAAAA